MLHTAPAVAAGLALTLCLAGAAGPRPSEPTRHGTVTAGASPEVVSRAAAAGPYQAPLDAPTLLERFRAPAHSWGPGHRGIDLAARAGQAVRAPADGTVTFSGRVVDRGVLTLTHPDGLRSSLEPVVDGLAVGTSVSAGDPVAVVGHGGHCTTRCLHWGVRRGSTYLDPMDLLPGRGPVVLLPRD